MKMSFMITMLPICQTFLRFGKKILYEGLNFHRVNLKLVAQGGCPHEIKTQKDNSM